LADSAEALNGKLYLMGGGWDNINVMDLSRSVPLAIACGVTVPWTSTDDDHRLTLRITSEDGTDVIPTLQANFKTGRPPSMRRGYPAHVPFAIKAEILFPAAATYILTAAVDDQADSTRRLPFHVQQIAQPGPIVSAAG
jgi:hypothetical protein